MLLHGGRRSKQHLPLGCLELLITAFTTGKSRKCAITKNTRKLRKDFHQFDSTRAANVPHNGNVLRGPKNVTNVDVP